MKTKNNLPLMVPESNGLDVVDVINSGILTSDISYEAQASMVRNTTFTGFLQISDISKSLAANSKNSITILTESNMYVNGYELKVPPNLLIDLGTVTDVSKRDDLIFLEVWKSLGVKEDYTSTTTGRKYELTYTTPALLEWRVRQVKNVDFTKFNDNGFAIKDQPIASLANNAISARGGNNAEIPLSLDSMFVTAVQRQKSSTDGDSNNVNIVTILDTGLYVAGKKNQQSIDVVKSLDGYVYAVPLFRIKGTELIDLRNRISLARSYTPATSTTDGLLSKEDKVKIDSQIAVSDSNPNNNSNLIWIETNI